MGFSSNLIDGSPWDENKSWSCSNLYQKSIWKLLHGWRWILKQNLRYQKMVVQDREEVLLVDREKNWPHVEMGLFQIQMMMLIDRMHRWQESSQGTVEKFRRISNLVGIDRVTNCLGQSDSKHMDNTVNRHVHKHKVEVFLNQWNHDDLLLVFDWTYSKTFDQESNQVLEESRLLLNNKRSSPID